MQKITLSGDTSNVSKNASIVIVEIYDTGDISKVYDLVKIFDCGLGSL